MTRRISVWWNRSLRLGALDLLWASMPWLGAAARPPALSGVVVEEVGEGSALDKAGLEAGEVLLAWRRLPQPSASPGAARGELASAFDWMWLVVEQPPRGTVELVSQRGGKERVFTVAPGLWEAEVRPWMPPTLVPDYLRGRDLVAAGNVEAGISLWEKLAYRAPYHWAAFQIFGDWR